MSTLRIAAVFLMLLGTVSVGEAGSGSKSSGSGRRSSGSGNRSADPASTLENTVMRYDGRLTKGEKDGDKEATMTGLFSLRDGFVMAERAPGSSSKAARLDGPDAWLVAYEGEPPATAIGEYRLSRRGKLTLLFGTSSKKLRNAKEDDGSGKKDDDGSGKKTGATPVSDEGAAEPLNGVMVLSLKKLRSGEVWAGSFREQDAKGKTVRTWQVRVQPAKNSAA